MITNAAVTQIIANLFEEEALVIGGLVALHHVDDDLVWRLVRSLDVIRGKVLRQLEDQGGIDGESDLTKQQRYKPHPAIEEVLSKLRRQ